jgi:hypothetical protein
MPVKPLGEFESSLVDLGLHYARVDIIRAIQREMDRGISQPAPGIKGRRVFFAITERKLCSDVRVDESGDLLIGSVFSN